MKTIAELIEIFCEKTENLVENCQEFAKYPFYDQEGFSVSYDRINGYDCYLFRKFCEENSMSFHIKGVSKKKIEVEFYRNTAK